VRVFGFSTPFFAIGLATSLGAQSVKLNGPLAAFPGSVLRWASSPDGNSVVYVAQQDTPEWELYRVSILGGPTTRLSTPVVTGEDVASDFVIAPDSKHVVYKRNVGFRGKLFGAPLAGGTAVELDGSPDTDGLAFDAPRISPDGSRVFYHARPPVGSPQLYSVPITGGTPVLLSGTTSIDDDYEITPDSTQVVFLSSIQSSLLTSPQFELYRVPADGSSAPVRISPPPTRAVGDVDTLGLSPDGNWVVFSSTVDTDTPVLYSARLAGGPLHVLSLPSNSHLPFSPIVTGDSTRALFLERRFGSLELFSVPLDGSVSALPINGPLEVETFSSTPDGSYVLLVQPASSSNPRMLYSVPVDGGALVPLVAPGLTFQGRGGNYTVSHDGTRVFYTAEHVPDARVGLYAVAVSGGPSTELHPSIVPSQMRFAPDDSRVVLLDELTQRILSVPTTGGPAVDIADGSFAFTFTSDSRSLLVRGDLEHVRRFELFRVPARGGRPVKLNGPLATLHLGTVEGFAVLPDETHVAYRAEEVDFVGSQLLAADAQGLTRVRLDPASPEGTTIESSTSTADGKHTLFVRSLPGGGHELDSVLSDGGDPHTLAFAQNGGSILSVAPSPRGTFAAYRLNRHELFLVSIRGGAPLRLNAPLVAGGDVLSFQFAPRGGRILYLADQDRDERAELYSVSLAAGSRVKLNGALAAGTSVADFAITSDGTQVVFGTHTRRGAQGIFRVPSDGSEPPSPILRPDGTPAPVLLDGYRLTTDGASVVFLAGSRLYCAPVVGGPTVELGLDVLQAGDQIDAFELASGGADVAFRLQRGSTRRLFAAPLAGGNSNELIGVGGVSDFHFSPLGDRVVYSTDATFTGRHLFVAPLTGGFGTLLSGTLTLSGDFQLDPGGVRAGFVDRSGDLQVTRLDGLGGPKRVNELGVNVSPFALGRERAFYLARPEATPGSAELFARPFASLP
jgi:Tol biopolymer transport system component